VTLIFDASPNKGLVPDVTQPLEAIVSAGLFVAPRDLAAIRAKAGE